jgi:hypothetical protein
MTARDKDKDNKTYHCDLQVFNFLRTGPLRIIQQLGTVAKPSTLSSLNLSQPYACQKALTEKHRQLVQPVL